MACLKHEAVLRCREVAVVIFVLLFLYIRAYVNLSRQGKGTLECDMHPVSCGC